MEEYSVQRAHPWACNGTETQYSYFRSSLYEFPLMKKNHVLTRLIQDIEDNTLVVNLASFWIHFTTKERKFGSRSFIISSVGDGLGIIHGVN